MGAGWRRRSSGSIAEQLGDGATQAAVAAVTVGIGARVGACGVTSAAAAKLGSKSAATIEQCNDPARHIVFCFE